MLLKIHQSGLHTKSHPSVKTAYLTGFTLIELLVVIAIIAMLASIILASLSSARVKGRDAVRISSAKEIEKALELYASSNNGNFPTPTWVNSPNCGNQPGCITDLTSYLTPSYMKTIPVDPKYDDTGSNYRYCAVGTTQYTLLTWSESDNNWCYPRVSARVTGTGCWITNGAPNIAGATYC